MRKLLEKFYNLLAPESLGADITNTSWIYKRLTQEERRSFSTQVNKEFILSILNAPWFKEDICKRFHQMYADRGNELMFLTEINYIKSDFGFSLYGNVFCHAKKYSDPVNYEKDCKRCKHFIVRAQNTPKGLAAKKIILLDDRLNQKIEDEIGDTIREAIFQVFEENAIRQIRFIEDAKQNN